MKENTKHILKQVNRLLKIGLLTFCWLMCAVGITAYSVYWLRQNANYEQEPSKQELMPKRAVSDKYNFSFWQLNYNHVNDELYVNAVNPPYTEYFHFTNAGAYVSVAYTYKGDILVKNVDTEIEYDGIQFQFEYHSAGFYNIYTIKLIGNGQSDLLIFTNNSPSTYNDCVIRFSNMRVWWADNIIDDADLGVMRYYFYSLVDTDNSVDFVLNNNFNPHLLITSEIISHNLISPVNYNTYPYETSYSIGFNFVVNGEYYNGINIGLQVLPYIYDETYGSRFELTTPPYLLHFTYIYYLRYKSGDLPSYCPLSDNKSGTDENGVYWRFVGYAGAQSKESLGGNIVYVRKSFGIDWVSDAYRYLQVDARQYETINYFQSYHARDTSAPYIFNEDYNVGLTLGDVLNRSISNVDYFLPISLGGGNSDVGLGASFTLLSTAFASLIPLLNIQIIPGITIGLLAFIPLIVTIIMVILRLVKK